MCGVFPFARLLTFVSSALVLLSASSSLANGIIYDNGTTNRFNGKEMTTWVEADDFTLQRPTRLSSIKFWNYELAGFFAGSVQWEIYSNDPANRPGTLLHIGTSQNLVHFATGYIVFNPFREHITTFDIGAVVLPAGRYWLALHNGPESNNSSQNFFWAATNNVGSYPSYSRLAGSSGPWASNAFPGYSAELTFQIMGAPLPEVQEFSVASGVATIRFSTTVAQQYFVEYKNNLTDAQWTQVLDSERMGTGKVEEVTDPDPPIGTAPSRFYRVVMQ